METDRKKLIKYVQSGSLLKLKSLLQKLNGKKGPKLNLNYKVGNLGRTPLHIACLLGDDVVVRCLLSHGAKSDVTDRNNDTPVHVAAQFILDDGNYQDYKLLIEPLIRGHPELLSWKNKNGETPADLLVKAREKYKIFRKFEEDEDESIQDKADEKGRWNSKLLEAVESDHIEQTRDFAFSGTSSSYSDGDYQTYDQWAERIFQEYQRKNFGMKNKRRRKEFQSRKRKQDMDDVTAHLLKNHDEYVAQVKRMKTEVLAHKRERYEKKFAESKQNSDSKLKFRDIPWPCQGNASEMVELLLSGLSVESSNSERKKVILRQLVLWHPDKFKQRCGDRLHEKDSENILDTVKAIAQELNRNLESLKSQD